MRTDPSPLVDTAPPRPDAVPVPVRRGVVHRRVLTWGVTPFLVAADVAASLLACLVTGAGPVEALGLALVTVLLLASARAYRSRLELSVLEDAPTLVWRSLAASACVVALHLLLVPGQVPPAAVLAAGVLQAGLLVLVRTVAYAVVRTSRARGAIGHPTLVLGAGQVGGQLARMLIEHRAYGLRPVGFLDSSPLLPEVERPVPVLGGPERLAQTVVELGVHAVVVAFSSERESQMVDVIRTCDRLSVDVFTIPRLYELHQRGRNSDEVWGLPLLRLRRAAFRSPTWRLKRVLDVLVSATLLLLLSPVIGGLALAVRLQGPGVLFRQTRVGLDGRPFSVLKLRSMRPVDETESQTNWSIVGDDRVTRLGRVLRATSLDELPQLWNVLRGDMTLVGPRPERPHFVEQFAQLYPRYDARHRVPAGVTGWAQVHGLRGDTSIEERARFDNYYIENWSLWSDIKILLRTVGAVLRRTGS